MKQLIFKIKIFSLIFILILFFYLIFIFSSTKYYRNITIIDKSTLNIYNHIYYQNDIEVIRQNKEYFKFVLLKDLKLNNKEDIKIYASGINNQIYIESQALSEIRAYYISNEASNILYKKYFVEYNNRFIDYYRNYFVYQVRIKHLNNIISNYLKRKSVECINTKFCKYDVNIHKFEKELHRANNLLNSYRFDIEEPLMYNKNLRVVYFDQTINYKIYLFFVLIYLLFFLSIISISNKKN